MKKVFGLLFIGMTVFTACFQIFKASINVGVANYDVVRNGEDEEGIVLHF